MFGFKFPKEKKIDTGKRNRNRIRRVILLGPLRGNIDVLQGGYSESLSTTKHFEFQLNCSPCVYTDKWICISEKVDVLVGACVFVCEAVVLP